MRKLSKQEREALVQFANQRSGDPYLDRMAKEIVKERLRTDEQVAAGVRR